MKRKVSLLLIVMLLPLTAVAKDKELMSRVSKLESMMQGRGLISIMTRLDQLEGEIQRLNGENENLRYQLELTQRREKELYAELNKRLEAEESKTPLSLPPPVVLEPAPTEVAAPVFPNVDTENASAPEPVTPTEPSIVEPTVIEPAPVADTSGKGDGEEAYQTALQKLRNGEYETAATALAAFPAEYPKSSYLPNAYYWQGEAEYVLNHFDKAAIAFQTVIDRFPVSNKVADATLKLGFSQQAQGNTDAAKATLTKVIQQYPGTSAAKLAQGKMDSIGQ